ncbi:MAG: tetratricopeptide repeat protein [Thermoplasmata archaeon]
MVAKLKDLEILESSYKNAVNSRGEIVLLYVDYGMDVDDLFNALQKDKQNDNTIFLKTECVGYKNVEPYYCFLEILDSIKNKDLYLNVDLKIEELNPENYDPIVDPIIYERFIEIFSTILYSYNIVLYIKNIQLGDINSLNLFSYLADFSINKNILVVASYYISEESNPHFNNVLSLLELKANVKKLKIEQFTLGELFLFLKEGRYNIPEYIIEIIYNITKGNKLKVLEILSTFETNKYIDEDKNWIAYDIEINEDFFKTPDPIMINTYYNLDEKHLLILNNAAIIGENFKLQLLKSISNVDENLLNIILKDLVDMNIINFKDKKYFFVSSSFRFYVYSKISNIRKKVVHKKIAEILELEQEDPAIIAYHFFNAGIKEKAYRNYLDAGFNKMKSYDFKTAYEYFKKAEQINGDINADVKFALAEVYKNMDRYEESINYYNSSLEELSENNKIVAYASLGTVYTRLGNTEIALKYFKQVLENSNDPKLLVIAHRGIANIYFIKKDLKNAQEHISIALEILKGLDDHYEIAETYKDLGKIYAEKNESVDQIERVYLKALEEYFKINYYSGIAKTYNNIADIYLEKKSLSESKKYFEIAMKYANLGGNYAIILAVNYNLSKIYLYEGDIRKYLSSINISKKLMDIEAMGEFSFLINYSLGNFSLLKGNFNESKKYFLSSRDLALKLDIFYRWVLANERLFYIEMIVGKNPQIDILIQNWQNMRKFETSSVKLAELESKIAYYILYDLNEDIPNLFDMYINSFKSREYSMSLLNAYLLYGEFLLYNYNIHDFIELYDKIYQLSKEKDYRDLNLQILNIVYYYITEDPRFSGELEKIEYNLKENSLIFLLSKLYFYLGVYQVKSSNDDFYLKKSELLFLSIGAYGFVNSIKKIKK